MSDGYLVSLLFNDGSARGDRREDECFGAEDEIRRVDSATSTELVPGALNANSSFRTWDGFAAIGRQQDCNSDCFTPRAHLTSSAIYSAEETALVYGASASYSSQSSAYHNPEAFASRRTVSLSSGSTNSFETRSLLSERLQSCLQTDHLGLEGFQPQASFPVGSPEQAAQSPDGSYRKCRHFHRSCHHGRPGYHGCSCSSLQGLSYQEAARSEYGDHTTSHTHFCHHSHSESNTWLQFAVGLGDADPAAISSRAVENHHSYHPLVKQESAEAIHDRLESSSQCSSVLRPSNSFEKSKTFLPGGSLLSNSHPIKSRFSLSSSGCESTNVVSFSVGSVPSSVSTAADTQASSSFTSSAVRNNPHQQLPSRHLNLSPSPKSLAPPFNKGSPGSNASVKEIATAEVASTGIAATLGGLLSGKTGGKTLIPGKYAPRHLATAAVAVPARIYRKFRTPQPPPVIPEEPECVLPRSDGSNAASSGHNSATEVATSTPKSRPKSSRSEIPHGFKSMQRPKTKEVQSKRQQLAIPISMASDSTGSTRKPGPFVTIPCIQGALSVRHTTSATTAAAARAAGAAAAATAATAAGRPPYNTTGKAEAQKGWGLGARFRRLSSSVDPSDQSGHPKTNASLLASTCWQNVVCWGGLDDPENMWGFLEAAEYKTDLVQLTTSAVLSTDQTTTSGTQYGMSPGYSQQSTTAGQSSNNTISSFNAQRIASSQRSCRREVGSGVVLGTGDATRDRASSSKGLDQYIRVARSIRRISRAFHSVISREGAERISMNTPPPASRVDTDCSTPTSISNTTRHSRTSGTPTDVASTPRNKIGPPNFPEHQSSDFEGSSHCCSYGQSPSNRCSIEDNVRSGTACSDSACSAGPCERCDPCWCCADQLQQTAFGTKAESEFPCKAACWAEVLIFIQSIFRLQLRQKKLKTLAAAAHLHTNKQFAFLGGRTVDNSEGSTKTSSHETKLTSGRSAITTSGSSGQNANPNLDNGSKERYSKFAAQQEESDLSEDARVMSSSYWIVFVALWIEKRMHLVARQRGDPFLVQRFCCCRLFTPADLKQSSTSNGVSSNVTGRPLRGKSTTPATATSAGGAKLQNGVYLSSPNERQQARVLGTVSSATSLATPQQNKSFSTPHEGGADESMEAISMHSYADLATRCSHRYSEKKRHHHHHTDNSSAADFSLVETVDLEKEDENLTSNWGPQIDTIKRFLILCFCAWSWIEDETITSGNVVAILQHIWWCTDTQINLGLSDLACKRHSEAVQKRGPKSFNSSLSPNSDLALIAIPGQRKHSGSIGGRVSKICDAVVSASGGRLLAQYFGQQSLDGAAKDNESVSNRWKGTDFYAEYLALPTSCSTGDFESQVFFLMRAMGFKLAAFPELVISLSSRWQSELDAEQCCSKVDSFNKQGLVPLFSTRADSLI